MSSEEHNMYWKKKQDSSVKIIFNYYYIKNQSLDSFKALLKKCPNITSIRLGGSHHKDCENVRPVFQVLIENCNNLSEVYVLNYLNDSNFEELHQKIGPKVKYLRFYRQITELNRFPNIEELVISHKFDQSIVPQLELSNLKQLDVVLYLGQEHFFKLFIDKFQKLTHFSVIFFTDNENAIYESLKNISNLKHLIHFRFNNQFSKNNEKFCGLLKQMANICQNLKSISCSFNINDQNSNIRQFFSQLKTFPALKRLDLFICYVRKEDEYDIDVKQLFSFELFEGLSNITHLSFHFSSKENLNESILNEIDINLPNLQYLDILNRFDTTPEGVTQMAETLIRLSRLETLKLMFISGVDFKSIEKQITEKCRKIKEIKIINI